MARLAGGFRTVEAGLQSIRSVVGARPVVDGVRPLSTDNGLEAQWTETRFRMGAWPAVTVSVAATVTHHGGRFTEHGLRITATVTREPPPVETTSIGSMSTAARSNSIAA